MQGAQRKEHSAFILFSNPNVLTAGLLVCVCLGPIVPGAVFGSFIATTGLWCLGYSTKKALRRRQ